MFWLNSQILVFLRPLFVVNSYIFWLNSPFLVFYGRFPFEHCICTFFWFVHAYVHTFMHAYVRRACIHACMHTYIRTYIRTYIHIHTYIHSFIHSYIHTHTYIHTYGRLYIHTYILCLQAVLLYWNWLHPASSSHWSSMKSGPTRFSQTERCMKWEADIAIWEVRLLWWQMGKFWEFAK